MYICRARWYIVNMMMKGTEMIRIGTDISGDDYEGNWKFLGKYINRGAKLVHYTHEGPAGGNPYVELEFPDTELLREFADDYHGYELDFEEFDDWINMAEAR